MEHVPEEAAGGYGDTTFGFVMLAKTICVYLVNDLGYDLLFQDVDISWYKNPVDFFSSDENSGFDVYFQGKKFISISHLNLIVTVIIRWQSI